MTKVNKHTKVANNKVISIAYILTLTNGEEIDRTAENDPLVYLHGHDNIIPGLESALSGRKVGEKLTLTVNAVNGYGERDLADIDELERSLFPDDLLLEVGMALELRDPETDEVIDAIITEVKDESVVLDYNHPLAGEDLNFDVEIISIRAATDEELEHGQAYMAE